MGVDGLLRIGGRRGVILTGELLIDDFDVHRMQQIFTGNGSPGRSRWRCRTSSRPSCRSS